VCGVPPRPQTTCFCPCGQNGGVTNMRYEIKRGDTLSQLAERHGLTVKDLMRENPQIENADKIYEGDDMEIPITVRAGVAKTLADLWHGLWHSDK
jgi:hypothetical protein